jgi:hypothetical protein
MRKVSEYRRHADECRALAALMPSGEQRDQLLAMAETWDRLAEDRGRTVASSESETFAPENREA